MNYKYFMRAAITLLTCVICFSLGYHAGLRQVSLRTDRHSDFAVLQRESQMAALGSVYVNSLHPATNTLVHGGLVEP
jgi:hypothetical protein